MKKYKKLLLGLFLCCLFFPLTIQAAGKINKEQDVSLTLSCSHENVPFYLYYVASIDEYGELSVNSSFSDFNVNITGKNDEAWNDLALTLAGYVDQEQMVPAASKKTDVNGVVTFPSLDQGLYLICSEKVSSNGMIYQTSPSMILLPSLDDINNDWVYDVNVIPKGEEIEDTNTSIKVQKVWKDAGNEKSRPSSIMVQLYKDGEIYDSITLSEENNWQHIWENCSTKSNYTLVEQKLDGYSVVVSKEGITYLITNTYKTTTPSVPNKNIPFTGQLWWPVLVLVTLGLVFIVIGLIRRRQNEG
ncbi:Cna B-type domain-containing protein [Floccifex sp.]|uniref:Cna B-type domain-containing protein n=1 Tax=Floccifex sp. TaxID=2815810 RepID=UPI003F0368F8